MELGTFINLSSESERQRLCELTETTLGYLRKLASNKGGASPYKAFQIEKATHQLSKRHKLLQPVEGCTLCDEQKYRRFLKQIGQSS